MPRSPAPAVAAALSFVDAVNRGDVDALAAAMADEHRMIIFDEDPVFGRTANMDGWRAYLSSYPDYVIYPHRITEDDGVVAILGHTTGSHLGLPDAEESAEVLIWVATVVEGRVAEWRLVPDDPVARSRHHLA
jgi:hypothetical protein